MRTYRTTVGTTDRRPYFSDEEFETTCTDELARVGLLPSRPEPIRIERFIEKRFDISPRYIELPDPLLGVTVFTCEGVKEILVTRALDEEGTQAGQRRARTTLGHEAGHGIFHLHLYALELEQRPLFEDVPGSSGLRVECKVDPTKMKTRIPGYSGDWKEFQANRAMSCLLMPRPLVQQAIAPFSLPVGKLGRSRPDPAHLEEAARTLAETFDVNPQVARLRLDHL